jgi:uncharacterized protein YfkK (UPF0435 family)
MSNLYIIIALHMKTTISEQFNFLNENLTENEKVVLLLVIEQFHSYTEDKNNPYIKNMVKGIQHKLNLFELGIFDKIRRE